MDEKEYTNIDEIKRGLERLKALDQQFLVFGAEVHKYNTYPMSIEEIEYLEGELGVRIPEDYRQLLFEIGYGAGPYYGLFSPKEILEELREEHYIGQTRLPDPNRPFPFSREQAQVCFNIMSEGRQTIFETALPTDGCIPVCFEGCEFYTYLVTSGELVGSMWSNGGAPDNFDDPAIDLWNLAPHPPAIQFRAGGWEPALSPLPSFLEWYRSRIQLSLADCMELHLDRGEPTSSGNE